MPVRSAQLSAGIMVSEGWYSAFDVPTGWTYLIKSLAVANFGLADTELRLWGTTAGLTVLLARVELPSYTSAYYPLWVALQEATDVSWHLVVAQETHVWLSGTQLPGVQPFPSSTPSLRLG